jgi:hypothetical protein
MWGTAIPSYDKVLDQWHRNNPSIASQVQVNWTSDLFLPVQTHSAPQIGANETSCSWNHWSSHRGSPAPQDSSFLSLAALWNPYTRSLDTRCRGTFRRVCSRSKGGKPYPLWQLRLSFLFLSKGVQVAPLLISPSQFLSCTVRRLVRQGHSHPLLA